MKIRLVSDLHLEFNHTGILPIVDDEKNTVLVIAGDLTSFNRRGLAEDWLKTHSSRFRHTIYIMGNHEFYNGDFNHTLDAFQEYSADNISIINNEVVCIDDIRFICSTLWTDFNRQNPMDMAQAQYSMNDYRVVTIGGESLKPSDTYIEHLDSMHFIRGEVTFGAGKQVIISHHLPSFQCIGDEHRTSNVNSSYASDLDNLFYDYDIAAWFHGHTHKSVGLTINDTPVVCNPFGYYQTDENLGFRRDLIINV